MAVYTKLARLHAGPPGIASSPPSHQVRCPPSLDAVRPTTGSGAIPDCMQVSPSSYPVCPRTACRGWGGLQLPATWMDLLGAFGSSELWQFAVSDSVGAASAGSYRSMAAGAPEPKNGLIIRKNRILQSAFLLVRKDKEFSFTFLRPRDFETYPICLYRTPVPWFFC